MGEVYRARDARLKRDVAIKVLPPSFATDADRLRRFEQEAQAAGALNHPNLTAVYDIGTHEGAPYIVQELLEGETLRAALAAGLPAGRRAVDYASQIARGLAAAHEKGIVHRDLKPENVFVTRDGRVKILDFGLAKLVDTAAPDGPRTDLPTAPAATEPGVVLGTLGYMSPEQVRGRPADARSDLFSLGAILYEMLTGRRAFTGDSAADTMSAILKEDPPELSGTSRSLGPSGLEPILRRCLEKSPDQRFQSAKDLAFALEEISASSRSVQLREGKPSRRVRVGLLAASLAGVAVLWILLANRRELKRWISAGPSSRVTSIAVLPLKDFSGRPEQEYFVDGMTEAVTTNLAQIGALKVISGTSAMSYKGSKKPLREIAGELGVDAVLEGSVARSGDRVRVTAQLIHAGSDTHLWAKTFERNIEDVLALQGELARDVARQIEAELTSEEQKRLTRSARVDPRAYEAYLRGRVFLEQGSEEDLKKGLDQFTRALEIDGNYAAPHAGIASYYAILPFYSQSSPADVFPQARAAARRSIELDETLAEPHASLAYIHAYYEWDWTAAEESFRRAIALRPSYADAHFSYSRFLAAAGRFEEAFAEIARARELDPRSMLLKANTALLSYFQGRYDESLAELLEVRKLDPKFSVAQWGIGLVYEQKGKLPEAVAEIEKATTLSKSLNVQSSLGHAYAVAGQKAKAQAILDMLGERSKKGYVPSYYFALIHAGLGDEDRALDWLDRAYQERSTVLAYLQIDPRLANLRDSPRFQDLVRRIGFATRPA
jgi:serine/threonine protein kinase/tetratricopeptide (TPR) repeat protein